MPTVPTPLATDAIAEALAGLPGWRHEGDALVREWRFAGFPAAIAFMQACVAGIEARDHHPEWTNVHARVSARLRTHDAGDRVTALDIELAAFLEDLARRHGA